MSHRIANISSICFQRHIHIDTPSKIAFEITKHWVWSMNATFRVDLHPTWGYYDNKTGRINGMVGQLIRNEADISGK